MARAIRGGPLGSRLVPASSRHVAALRDGFNSGAVAATTIWRLPRSTVAFASGKEAVRRYAIEVEGRLVGVCGLWAGRYAGLELTIAIFDPRLRNLGIGTFAVSALCRIAFADIKSHRVELGVYPQNAGAIRAYAKCGFRREALLRRYMYHNGRWRDVLWMSLLRRDWKIASPM